MTTIVFIFMCLYKYIHMCTGDHRPPKDVRSPRAGIIGHCELPHMYAGNQTQVPWESTECSLPLSHLSIPIFRSYMSPIDPFVGALLGGGGTL